jgi:hypothetical protein
MKLYPGILTLLIICLFLSQIEESVYKGVKLTNVEQAKGTILANAGMMVGNMVACLNERYGVLTSQTEEERAEMQEAVTKESRDGDNVLHDVCRVLRTSVWINSTDQPLSWEELSSRFCNQITSLKRIYERFQPVLGTDINSDILEEQYLQLVKYTCDSMGNNIASMEPLQLWPTLKQIKGESYPELFSVIELCLCAPFSNATLERFFSHMAVVKNDWRNRLGEEALEDNLRIHISGPDVAKLPESQVIIKAVTNWYNDKPRRLNQKKRKKYKKRTTSKKPNLDKDPGLFLNLSDAVTWDNDVADSESSSEEENTDTLHSQENDKHT